MSTIEDPGINDAFPGIVGFYAHVTVKVNGEFRKALRISQFHFAASMKRSSPRSQEDWRAFIYSRGGPWPSEMGRVYVELQHDCAYIYWDTNKDTRIEYQKDSPL